MNRGFYWLGMLLGVELLVAGVLVGTLSYSASAGPGDVVRDYFAALARGDASRALAYGTVPAGPTTLLTDAALAEQQRIAPIRDVSVRSIERTGSTTTVTAKYVLAYPGEDVPVSAQVALHKSSGDWRLDAVAVSTTLVPGGGRQREAVLGGAVPTGAMLFFPGALPIRLDTPYLKLSPSGGNITFGELSRTYLTLQVSAAGRAAMLKAVRTGLRNCLSGNSDPTCPLPDERYVPGSVRGSVKGELRASVVTIAEANPVGMLRFSGRAAVRGSWRRLDFHNRQVAGHGTIQLDIAALAYAARPLRLWWDVS